MAGLPKFAASKVGSKQSLQQVAAIQSCGISSKAATAGQAASALAESVHAALLNVIKGS